MAGSSPCAQVTTWHEQDWPAVPAGRAPHTSGPAPALAVPRRSTARTRLAAPPSAGRPPRQRARSWLPRRRASRCGGWPPAAPITASRCGAVGVEGRLSGGGASAARGRLAAWERLMRMLFGAAPSCGIAPCRWPVAASHEFSSSHEFSLHVRSHSPLNESCPPCPLTGVDIQ